MGNRSGSRPLFFRVGFHILLSWFVCLCSSHMQGEVNPRQQVFPFVQTVCFFRPAKWIVSPPANDIHFTRPYCLWWKWEICIRRGAMSHSSSCSHCPSISPLKTVDRYGACSVVWGRCGCDCVSMAGLIKAEPSLSLLYLCNCILLPLTGRSEYQMIRVMKVLKWDAFRFQVSRTNLFVAGCEDGQIVVCVCVSEEGKQWSAIIWKGGMRRLINHALFVKGYVATSEGTYSALAKGNKKVIILYHQPEETWHN